MPSSAAARPAPVTASPRAISVAPSASIRDGSRLNARTAWPPRARRGTSSAPIAPLARVTSTCTTAQVRGARAGRYGRRGRRSHAGPDVLAGPEAVVRVVDGLDARQAGVVGAVARAHGGLALLEQTREVEVG